MYTGMNVCTRVLYGVCMVYRTIHQTGIVLLTADWYCSMVWTSTIHHNISYTPHTNNKAHDSSCHNHLFALFLIGPEISVLFMFAQKERPRKKPS